jgi:UDP:flavonoid glycosyltransferase YjiC (YdhE family)
MAHWETVRKLEERPTMAKIIVATPPVPGEFRPLLQIAEGLAGRGHDITFVTGSRFRRRSRPACRSSWPA